LNDEQILAAHLGGLAPVYRQLAAISDSRLQAEAGRLIDLILSEQLAAPVRFPPEDAIPALRAAVEKAKPDRRCMEYLLKSFAGWVEAVSPAARGAFLEVIPELAPAAYDLNDEGMRMVLEAAAADTGILRPVAGYAMTTDEAIRAVASIARQAAEHRRVDLLQALATAFPAEKMEESKDAEKLLPALKRMVEVARAWTEGMQLGIALAERNASAARSASKDLVTVLGRLPAGDHGPYLDDFRLIVEAVGIRAAGFGLRTLPGLYQRHGAGPVRRFVSLACQAAESAGVLAGEAFLERKTEAARGVLT
jgi:hypothetical protein